MFSSPLKTSKASKIVSLKSRLKIINNYIMKKNRLITTNLKKVFSSGSGDSLELQKKSVPVKVYKLFKSLGKNIVSRTLSRSSTSSTDSANALVSGNGNRKKSNTASSPLEPIDSTLESNHQS